MVGARVFASAWMASLLYLLAEVVPVLAVRPPGQQTVRLRDQETARH